MPNLLFLIGMQKSGTSLFNRILMQQSFINNPFLPEGRFFWGDNPPFSPVAKPCGELFQQYNGFRGHYLDGNDFNLDDRDLLTRRINQAKITEPVLMNKNPYNSVRIGWLKRIFPESRIIAIYRNPIANIYSLLKKYVDYEDSWWGIKPKGWESMVCENKLEQSINQWNAVNKEILNNIHMLDLLVNYDDLCKSPAKISSESIKGFNIQEKISGFPNIKNMNDEYLFGSRIASKNQELRQSNNFDLTGLEEDIEFPKFEPQQVYKIEQNTNDIWTQLLTSSIDIKR